MSQGSQGFKAPAGSRARLASLPDDVLLRCLAHLTQQERCVANERAGLPTCC